VVVNPSARSIAVLDAGNQDVLCFVRSSPSRDRALAVVANLDVHNAATATVAFDTELDILTDELAGTEAGKGNGHFRITLAPGQVMVFELRTPTMQFEEFVSE
jgi:hypothetical protein